MRDDEAQAPAPRRSTDARGRAIPMTEDEVRARAPEIIRALDAVNDMGDEEEQRETFDYLVKVVDEDRLSYRKRFRE